MSTHRPREMRFVRALVSGAIATREDSRFVAITADGTRVTIEASDVAALQSRGVLDGNGLRCTAGSAARGWLRRAIAEADGFTAQHRQVITTADGKLLNLAESPLSRLAVPGPDGTPAFLAPHQIEAGERIRKLADRAHLQPRVTMSYDPAHTAAGTGAGTASEMTDMAAEARRQLSAVARALPADCAGVVLDVCGLLKGLQTVEVERGWPRRSAKLVLRIGLEQLAQHFGLTAVAVGKPSSRPRGWRDEGARPTVFE
jgi:hypothetical protein